MQPLSSHSSRVERNVALISLALSAGLLGLKFAAYYATGSSAVFSDALESIVNVVASAFALYSLQVSHRPPDADHPYGHGKIEFLSAGFEGGMILLAALVIVVRAVDALVFHAPAVQSLAVGMGLMALAMVLNGGWGWYLIRAGRKRGAIALEADGHHLLSDAVTSVAALVGLAIVRLSGWPAADPITAIVIAVYIAFMGWILLRRSAGGLMDRQDDADALTLRRILDSHTGPAGAEPRICSYHKLRHRHSGRYHWVEFHIMVPADWDIAHGHRVASAIEYQIEQTLGTGNATAHVEPCFDPHCRHCHARGA